VSCIIEDKYTYRRRKRLCENPGDFMSSYIVKLSNSVSNPVKTITDTGATITKVYKISGLYQIECTNEQLQQIAGVESHEEISKSVDVSHAYETYDITHLSTLGFSSNGGEGWNPLDTSLGEGITVYLVDTGINVTHNELSDANIFNLYSGDNATGYTDTTGHGTGVCSLIVGKNIGVSPNAVIQNVKIFDTTNGNILVSDILEALDTIIEHHTQTGITNLKVVCLPWVATKNQLIDQAISDLLNLNLLVVAAAGNAGTNVDSFSPGGLDSVITVGAIDRSYSVTSFSNLPYTDVETAETRSVKLHGATLDIFALGVDVDIADISDNAGYKKGSGTSLSTALVSAVLTQYIKLYPDADAEIIKGYMYTKGYKSASRPAVNQNKSMLLSFDQVNAPAGQYIDFTNINYAIAVPPQTTEISFASRPSGRLINVKQGTISSTSIGIKSDATDVSVLEFTPLSPWMALDLITGDFTADLENNTDIAVGIYHFAVKGSVGNIVGVAEYAVGVYNNDISELEQCTEYYYDTDTETYEEAEPSDLVAFSSAK
jgi:hypothetical protein